MACRLVRPSIPQPQREDQVTPCCGGRALHCRWFSSIPGCYSLAANSTPAAAKSLQSCPTLCDPIDAANHAPPSPGFSRQEHWSGLPFPSPMHESEKWKSSRSVVADFLRPHGLQPTRLLHPWDFPGKSTGVGCHCLLWIAPLVVTNSIASRHCQIFLREQIFSGLRIIGLFYDFIAYWNIVDVQGCVSFRCAAQWFRVFADIIHYRLLQDNGYISQWVCACVHMCMFSHVWLLVAPWTAAHCSPPGSSVHGIFQARVLEWVAISFSRGSSQPRDRTQVSHTAGRHFTVWATREAHNSHYYRVNACCLSILCIVVCIC